MKTTIDNILKDTNSNLENMTNNELKLLYDNIISNHNDSSFIAKVLEKTNKINNLKLTDVRKPSWMYGDTNFQSNTWVIKLNKRKSIIDFNKIIIDNKSPLVNHTKILNTFKFWICIQSHPIFNNGVILNPNTISSNISNIINFINFILFNAKELNLIKSDLKNINEDFIIEFLVNSSKEGRFNASINYNIYVTKFLKEKIKNVNIDDVINFEKKHPYYESETYDQELGLNTIELRKSKYWLYINKAYSYNIKNKIKRNFFINFLEHKIILLNKIPSNFNQLDLYKSKLKSEYKAIPNTTNDEIYFSFQGLQTLINNIKKISFVNYQSDCAQISIINFNTINLRRLSKITKLSPLGRYSTIPADVAFKLIKDSFEFIHKYLDVTLSTLYEYSQYVKSGRSFDEFYESKYFPIQLKEIGINSLTISRDNNYYTNLRKNRGFLDFYDILMASIFVAIGAITARRKSEILEIHPFDSLLPNNVNPLLNPNCDFELIFDNRKSGISGVNFHREKLSKPIVGFLARIIYKISQFNKLIIENKRTASSKIYLLNYYSQHTNKWKILDTQTYYSMLNNFCDYFEVKTIKYDEKDYRRYYIRQHQLRRFFAMMFFWSKSFDGLDTLRYFLGHTDIEHLYYYITDPLKGSVLNGVKSHTITEAYLGKSGPIIKNIGDLRMLLLNHFEVDDLEITSISNVRNLYTTNKVSNMVNYLIDENIIDLQPMFFMTRDKDNSLIQDFDLILIIKDTL